MVASYLWFLMFSPRYPTTATGRMLCHFQALNSTKKNWIFHFQPIEHQETCTTLPVALSSFFVLSVPSFTNLAIRTSTPTEEKWRDPWKMYEEGRNEDSCSEEIIYCTATLKRRNQTSVSLAENCCCLVMWGISLLLFLCIPEFWEWLNKTYIYRLLVIFNFVFF